MEIIKLKSVGTYEKLGDLYIALIDNMLNSPINEFSYFVESKSNVIELANVKNPLLDSFRLWLNINFFELDYYYHNNEMEVVKEKTFNIQFNPEKFETQDIVNIFKHHKMDVQLIKR